MNGVILALLLGAVASPSPTPAGYVLVQKDGAVVRLEKAPALKGSTYVGKLWPTGQLVSIPVASVDDRRTFAANAGGRAVAPPSETNIGTRYRKEGPQTPLGDQMKLKGGRKKVERTLQGTPAPVKAAESGRTGGEPGAGVDRNGHGEAWWRGRAAPLLEELADAEAELKLAGDERRRFEGPGAGPGAPPSRPQELQTLRGREEQARRRVAASRQRLAELTEEARRAGAPSSWIR